MSTESGSITVKNVNVQQINPDSLIKKKEDNDDKKEDEDK